MSDVITRTARHAVGVVLAAGAGTRLGDLGTVRPKPLCPVGGRALVDLAVERLRPFVDAIAVNVHHERDRMVAHLRRSASDLTISVEDVQALGTAGAIGRLRPWIAGRSVVVVNADAWLDRSTDPLVGWDGVRVRVIVAGAARFGPRAHIVASVLPWSIVERLEPVPSGLYETVWREASQRGDLDVVAFDGSFVDCGTPASLLDANLRAAAIAGGSIIDPTATIGSKAIVERSVVGAGARVDGVVRDSVVWDGQSVGVDERLERVIRTDAGFDVEL